MHLGRVSLKRTMVASRTIVWPFNQFLVVNANAVTPGFIYRHTASGPPTEGLYAHYDLGIELGKGSFATVHTAMHRVSGKWFAVKMIAGAKTGNRQNNNQSTRNVAIAREISIMEKLEHPNICKLVEVFFQNDNSISKDLFLPFLILIDFAPDLVLELVDGGDLLEHILSHGGLRKRSTICLSIS